MSPCLIPAKGRGRQAAATCQRLSQLLRRFAWREAGGVTAEFVIWFPLQILLFLLFIDVAIALWLWEDMSRVSRDAARGYSIGNLITESEVRNYIQTNGTFTTNFAVTLTDDSSDDSFTVRVTVPATDFSLFNLLSLAATQFRSQVTMYREPNL